MKLKQQSILKKLRFKGEMGGQIELNCFMQNVIYFLIFKYRVILIEQWYTFPLNLGIINNKKLKR